MDIVLDISSLEVLFLIFFILFFIITFTLRSILFHLKIVTNNILDMKVKEVKAEYINKGYKEVKDETMSKIRVITFKNMENENEEIVFIHKDGYVEKQKIEN